MKPLLAVLILAAGSLHAQSASALQSLQTQIITLRNLVTTLQAQVATQQAQINAINQNPVMKLGPYVQIDLNPEQGVPGPNLVFSGVNVHVVNGTGRTEIVNGLGNLLVGYSLNNFHFVLAGDRLGSHNLVVGDNNKWSRNSYANIIGGVANSVDGFYNTILGGGSNVMRLGNGNLTNGSVIIGGTNNTFQGASYSVILGGQYIESSNASFTVQ